MMYEDSRIGVVVPAYNEVGLVGDVIETMPPFVDRIYVVDDRSTDDTWKEIRACVDPGKSAPRAVTDGRGAPSPRVVPIRHEENRGVGAAITTGYERALADEMDVVAVMAGDGQMDPDQLSRLLDPIVAGRVDYAKGNRLTNGTYRDAMSEWRLFGNLLLSTLTKIASGYWELMDPQNGYTAISRRALERTDLEGLYKGYGFANHLLVSLNAEGFRIADVSMPAVYGEEESHIRYRSFVPNLSWLLLRTFVGRVGRRYLVREFHPLAFLYAVGVTGGTLAVVLTAKSVSARLSGDSGSIGSGSTTLLALSTISVLLAMTFDREENAGAVERIR